MLPAANVTVDGFEMDGDYIPEVMLAATNPITPTTGARMIMLKIEVTAETAKVTLKIAKGIASASFTNEDTSKELKVDIHIVDDDAAAGPKVYSIRREIPSSIPVTAATLNVIITLSEMPKEFKKDHIAVDNATHGDPVALTPIAEETVETVSRNILASTLTLTPKRGLYDVADPAATGIHDAINDNEDYTDPGVDGTGTGAFTGLPTDEPAAADIAAPQLVPPKMLAAAVTHDGVELPIGTDRTVVPPMPKTVDFTDVADYGTAIGFYNALKAENDAYKLELARHNAYQAAVNAEMAKDKAKNDMELLEHGVTLQRATGRTSMLYPYALTITPKYEIGRAHV